MAQASGPAIHAGARMTVEYALACLLVALTAIAALRDWQQRRIPNLLPLLLIAGGSVALLLRAGGSDSLLSSTLQSGAGLGIAAAATLPGYWSGAMGAGDVKLLASIGWALKNQENSKKSTIKDKT